MYENFISLTCLNKNIQLTFCFPMVRDSWAASFVNLNRNMYDVRGRSYIFGPKAEKGPNVFYSDIFIVLFFFVARSRAVLDPCWSCVGRGRRPSPWRQGENGSSYRCCPPPPPPPQLKNRKTTKSHENCVARWIFFKAYNNKWVLKLKILLSPLKLLILKILSSSPLQRP